MQQLYISVGCSNCIYALIVMCMHALLSIYVVHAGHTLGDYDLPDYLNVFSCYNALCLNKCLVYMCKHTFFLDL